MFIPVPDESSSSSLNVCAPNNALNITLDEPELKKLAPVQHQAMAKAQQSQGDEGRRLAIITSTTLKPDNFDFSSLAPAPTRPSENVQPRRSARPNMNQSASSYRKLPPTAEPVLAQAHVWPHVTSGPVSSTVPHSPKTRRSSLSYDSGDEHPIWFNIGPDEYSKDMKEREPRRKPHCENDAIRSHSPSSKTRWISPENYPRHIYQSSPQSMSSMVSMSPSPSPSPSHNSERIDQVSPLTPISVLSFPFVTSPTSPIKRATSLHKRRPRPPSSGSQNNPIPIPLSSPQPETLFHPHLSPDHHHADPPLSSSPHKGLIQYDIHSPVGPRRIPLSRRASWEAYEPLRVVVTGKVPQWTYPERGEMDTPVGGKIVKEKVETNPVRSNAICGSDSEEDLPVER